MTKARKICIESIGSIEGNDIEYWLNEEVKNSVSDVYRATGIGGVSLLVY